MSHGPGRVLAEQVRSLLLVEPPRHRGHRQAGRNRLRLVVPDERREHFRHRGHEALRRAVRRAAVADDQRVDLEHLLALRRKLAHVVDLPRLDLADPRERQPARKRRRVGQAQDLQVAPGDRVGDELRLVVDDHRAEIELAALEHVELPVDGLRRHDEVEAGERGQHAARHLLGAAADGTDAEPQALRSAAA